MSRNVFFSSQTWMTLKFNLDIFRDLTNQMWFSVVCTLIDNDMRHHNGQNVVDSRGAALTSSQML